MRGICSKIYTYVYMYIHVNNSFSPITGNRITNIISFDISIYIEGNKFGDNTVANYIHNFVVG